VKPVATMRKSCRIRRTLRASWNTSKKIRVEQRAHRRLRWTGRRRLASLRIFLFIPPNRRASQRLYPRHEFLRSNRVVLVDY
jgi:hypothetical protein